jgi:hypothetical protein
LHYAFVARIRLFTRLTLVGPRVARPGQRLTWRGRVIGRRVAGDIVVLEQARGRRWTPFARTRVGTDGGFSYATAAGAAGTYRIRALYRGDADHQPASVRTTLRVA